MKLWHVGTYWKTGKDIAVEVNALDIIFAVLSDGNESQQLSTLQSLVSLITNKLLEKGVLTLDDIKYEILENHWDSPFYKSKEEAEENCND